MKGVLTGNRFLSHHTIFGQMNFWTLPRDTKPVAPLGDQARICHWWRGTHYDSLVLSDAIWSRCSAQQAGRQPRDLLVGQFCPSRVTWIWSRCSAQQAGLRPLDPLVGLFQAGRRPRDPLVGLSGSVSARIWFRFCSGLVAVGFSFGSVFAWLFWLAGYLSAVFCSSWARVVQTCVRFGSALAQ